MVTILTLALPLIIPTGLQFHCIQLDKKMNEQVEAGKTLSLAMVVPIFGSLLACVILALCKLSFWTDIDSDQWSGM